MFDTGILYAHRQDDEDPLAEYRREFHLPRGDNGEPWIYLAGNSLGLQPKWTRAYVEQELHDWATLGVEGHLRAKNPWLPYHESLIAATARLVGAEPQEVVAMNSLTTNLHLMMVSFYRPTASRFKILVEGGAFPSDQYAVASQARFHGFDPATAVVELQPRPGESTQRTVDILQTLEKEGKSVALVLLGGVNYLTGQAFDMASIAAAARKQGCRVGFDLAHAVGNVPLQLHDWGADFAVWCSYKYLNAGPGAVAGCFVHARHAANRDIPRFTGWWGHSKATRFAMPTQFAPIAGAEGWQLSNPPILQLACLRASMEIFDQAGMPALRAKSERLTSYLEFLLQRLPQGRCEIITPTAVAERGAQLSLRLRGDPQQVLKVLQAAGVVCDFREPNIIRAAPTPLYSSFTDVYRFATILENHAAS